MQKRIVLGVLTTTTLLAGFLFLPHDARAQGDDKDELIRKLKVQLEVQQRQLQARTRDLLAVEEARKQLLLQSVEKDFAIARLTKEMEQLRKLVKDPKAAVLLAEVEQLRRTVVDAKNLAAARQAMNEKLLEQLREVTLKLARLEAGKDSAVLPLPEKRPQLNPPPVKIDGKIVKVEGNLVQIDVGADAGLKKDHTLEVYRLKPQPMYLGVLRIVEVNPRSAVGRMVLPANVAKGAMVQEGDLITSQLTK